MSQDQEAQKPQFPTIGEDYKIFEKLGEGAFGEVYKAHHALLDQDFAVKLLRPELGEDEEVRARFLDEARALIRFSHPNVVQMRHVGEFNGRLFLVMDFVKGEELLAVMKRDGPFEEQRALGLVKQILAGLESAHAAGIVHRDLKPSNIIVEETGDGKERIRILDFGLSKFSAIDGQAGAHRSITGTIVGTLAYMSPEQIKGDKDIDGRSDLFAVGLILQEMLQGHHPYPGDSGIVVAAKLLRDPIPPISGAPATQISDTTKSALARALERDRDARFASVMAFSQSLEGKGPPSDTSRVTTVLETQQELARQEAEAARAAKAAAKADGAGSGGGKSKVLIGVAALAVLGIAAFFLFGNKETDKPQGGTKTTASSGSGTPGTSEPDPAVTDPGPATTEPDPAVTEPDPAVKEPDPATTEPATTEPDPAVKEPDPATTEPATTEPDPAVKEPDPATTEPATTEPDPAVKEPTGGSELIDPRICCTKASPLFQKGKWAEARGWFQKAAKDSTLTDDVQLSALRGAAESWIAQADQLARAGKIEEALQHLAESLQWVQDRHKAYAGLNQAAQAARLQIGFARMHEGEAHVERARWLRVLGKDAEAAQEIAKAEVAYDFALDQLRRDGVRYWEFLIRRAEMFGVQGKTAEMVDDVAHTTKTNNAEVPAHMWVAHARALRRVGEAYALQGNAAAALEWARRAMSVAEDGVGWQDQNLTRGQWLEMARVLFFVSTVLPADEDPTALHGKIRYWVTEAGKAPAPVWVDGDVAKARLLTAQAMERNLYGRMMAFRKKDADAQKAYGEAAALITQAIELRDGAATRGVRLVSPLPYRVRAAIATSLGKPEEAAASLQAAQTASRANPD